MRTAARTAGRSAGCALGRKAGRCAGWRAPGPCATTLVAASALALCAAIAGVPRARAEIDLPEGPGADLVYARCRTCHDLQYLVDSAGLLPAQWDAVLQSMHDYGLKLDDADRREILDYLSTYLGPNPPSPTQTAKAPPSAASAGGGTATAAVDGHAVYERNCASCHGADARGEAQRVPPLADNDDLQRDPLLPVLVVLNGLNGPIDVQGAHFDSSMPAFDHLSDAQVAAVVNYLRDAPDGKTVTKSMVAEQRSRDLSAAQVHAYRQRTAQAQAQTQ